MIINKIKPTPVLYGKDAERFLKQVEAQRRIKTGPVETPKLKYMLRKFRHDVLYRNYRNMWE